MTVQRAPALPEGAGIVQPASEEERSATRLFLGWVAAVVAVGEETAARAEQGQRGCRS